MRSRRALLVCTIGVAICLVFVGLLQSSSTNEHKLRFDESYVRNENFRNDVDDKEISSNAYNGGVKPFVYQSLRYQTPEQRSLTRSISLDLENRETYDKIQDHVEPSPAAFSNNLVESHLERSKGFGSKRRRHKFARSLSEKAPNWISTTFYNRLSAPGEFKIWNSTARSLCRPPSSASFRRQSRRFGNSQSGDADVESQFIGVQHLFAELRNVIVDRKYCWSNMKGGEMIDDVVNQDESAEYYTVTRGCFQLACDMLPTQEYTSLYYFTGDNHLNKWLFDGLDFVGSEANKEKVIEQQESAEHKGSVLREAVFDGFTVAVVRYEYANLYHTTTDWYNAFLMMQYFGRTPAETNILLIDSHPFGALDSVWTQLFGSVTRLSALGRRTRFRELVWSIVGYESPMKIYADAPYPPLFNEFRRHVLSSYNIDSSKVAQKPRNCTSLNVLFIWRRDYLAHPRNPSGRVQRKFANERELLEYIQRRQPNFRISGVQIDLLDFREQLRNIVEADIVVGVHGAGLTHALFMKSDAGLAEIFPNDVWSANGHFEAIASWRKIPYVRWVNHDFGLEDEEAGTIRVPPYVANALVSKLVRQLCSESLIQSTDHTPSYNRRSRSNIRLKKSNPEEEISSVPTPVLRNANDEQIFVQRNVEEIEHHNQQSAKRVVTYHPEKIHRRLPRD